MRRGSRHVNADEQGIDKGVNGQMDEKAAPGVGRSCHRVAFGMGMSHGVLLLAAKNVRRLIQVKSKNRTKSNLHEEPFPRISEGRFLEMQRMFSAASRESF